MSYFTYLSATFEYHCFNYIFRKSKVRFTLKNAYLSLHFFQFSHTIINNFQNKAKENNITPSLLFHKIYTHLCCLRLLLLFEIFCYIVTIYSMIHTVYIDTNCCYLNSLLEMRQFQLGSFIRSENSSNSHQIKKIKNSLPNVKCVF